MKERIMRQKRAPDNETTESENLLDKFLKTRQTHPKAVTEQEVMSLSLTMVLAGAETMLESPKKQKKPMKLTYSYFIVP